MRISIYVLFLLFASLLNGCGGGGGGSSSSSTSTSCTQSSPCVFSSGVTMNYLRNMFFDATTNLLFVVDGDTNTCTANSYGHIRVFNGETGAYQNTYGGATDVICTNGVAVLYDNLGNWNVFTSGTTPIANTAGLINMSTGVYTNRAVISQAGYGLTVANNKLFMAYDNLGTVVVYNNSLPTPSLVPLVPAIAPGNGPTGLAYDSAGYVYVTTFTGGNAGVSKINTTSYAVSAFANSNLFDKPNGIAVRSTPREVYVVNTGTTESQAGILKISTDGNGNSTGVSTFMSASDLSSKLCSPVGIAISGNNLFIANGKCPTTGNNAYASTILKVAL